MSIWCTLGRHTAGERIVHNGGTHFSSCVRCCCDLVLGKQGWGPAPKGYRVVWKRRRVPGEAEPLQLELLFPADAAPAERRPGSKRRERAKSGGRRRPGRREAQTAPFGAKMAAAPAR